MIWQCPRCGRDTFDRPNQPHRCGGSFRKGGFNREDTMPIKTDDKPEIVAEISTGAIFSGRTDFIDRMDHPVSGVMTLQIESDGTTSIRSLSGIITISGYLPQVGDHVPIKLAKGDFRVTVALRSSVKTPLAGNSWEFASVGAPSRPIQIGRFVID